MAKTCFYCGRELAPGERCSCRGPVTGGSGTASSASSAQAAREEKASSATSSYDTSSGSSSGKEKRKKEAKTRVVRNKEARDAGKKRWSFTAFISQVRSIFPSFSKWLKPVMSYIWHPVTTIQQRSQVVSLPKVLLINSLFSAFTALMVLFTIHSDSPFLGMLISLIFGKTDLFSAHPVIAFFVMCAIFWICVLILALCFFLVSRLANRKLSFLRALDTVSISSIYLCFADFLVFVSVLFGTRGAFTLIFVALVIMGITHFISLKHDLALTDNATFNMLAVSYLLFYTLAQLSVGLLVRLVMRM